MTGHGAADVRAAALPMHVTLHSHEAALISRCGVDAVGGKGIKEAAGNAAPAARTAKEAEAKAEDDVEVRTMLLMCHVCYNESSSSHARSLKSMHVGSKLCRSF